jgi:hypothetical protein
MENVLKRLLRFSGFAAVAVAVVGCSSSATAPPTATTVVSPALSTLQLAVGTANIYGGDASSGNQSMGMNVVTTLRTPQGKSVLVSTPTLTGAFTLPSAGGTTGTPGLPDGTGSTVERGPAASEIAHGGIIGATPQVPPGTVQINPSSFGVSGGDFANGFMPSNADNVGTVNDTPYAQALYDQCPPPSSSSTCVPNPNSFTAWGGPPAFDPNHDGQGTRDGTFDTSVFGVAEGINVFFGVTVNPGAYTMNVIIPTINQNFTKTAGTNIPTVHTLGNAVAPLYSPDGNGGGTFAVTMPTGANDALVQILDLGPVGTSSNPTPLNCYKQGQAPAIFTIHVIGSGTATLPDNDGPGNPNLHSPTICTAAQNAAVGTTGADQIVVQLIAADYPLYASQYLFTLSNPAPNITGPLGTDDITISPASSGTGTRPSPEMLRRIARLMARHR